MSLLSRKRPHLVASSSSAQGKKKKVSMSVVSGEGMPLVPCSPSSAQRKEKKHVVIYYTTYGITYRLKGRFVCFPVDSLIAPKSPSKEKTRKKFKLKLPFSDGTYFKHGMSCICTTTSSVGAEETSPGPGLYLFGGMDPPVVRDLRLRYQYLLKKAYRYGLHNLSEEIGSAERCTDMIYGMSELLLAQVGDDCIYALGRGKTRDDESLEPAFLEYNFKENKWASLVDRHFVDIINNCDCDEWVRENLDFVPHIVIGRKLHVSLGNSSFTFDTENRVWEDCMLFKTFWSEQQKKRGRHCPSNFYGTEVWVGDTDLALKKRKRNKFGGGPPFGFSGRGILWDKDILLGIHYADNCALVAFQLDDEGRVVRSQRVTMDNLSMNIEFLRNGAKLVDLGRDDYFGLVHFLGDEDIGNHFYNEDLVHMQLVIFKVSRLAPQEIAAAAPDDDHDFLDCQFVRSKTLVKNCPQGIGSLYNVFCV